MTVKLTTEGVRAVGVFERLIGVHVRDCLMEEDCLYFLIEPNKMGMAIGKNGSKIKNLCKAFGKKVKIFEYSDNLEGMLRNFVPSMKIIEISNDVVSISVPVSERSTVIGKNGRNIKIIREFLKRHFKLKNLRLR